MPTPKKNKLWSSRKADLKFSHYIRDRDKGLCFFCKKPGSQNSHYWGRRASATRYDPKNCDYSCGGCHMRHESNKQGLYRTLKFKQLGESEYKALERRFYSTVTRREAIKKAMEFLNNKNL